MDKNIDYKKLQDLRKNNDLKQKQIADKLNIEQSAYSKIERGERSIGIDRLHKLAEIYGKKIEYFLKGNSFSPKDREANEIEVLDSIFCKLSIEIESEVQLAMYYYEQNYPTHECTFKGYMEGEYYFSPETAVNKIKSDLEEYQRTGEYSILYQTEKEFIGRFAGKDDSLLNAFVREENNFPFIYKIFGTGKYYCNEDVYQAFKDMISKEHFLSTLFAFGLLEGTRFGDLWWQLISEEENKNDSQTILYLKKAYRGHTESNMLVEKMKEIFNRRERTKYSFWQH